MEEIWKDIKGYEGYYQVSNQGRVRRIKSGKSTQKGRILKTSSKFDEYSRTGLSINGKVCWLTIHRLVAEAFIPNPEKKPCVNHIDGNKRNNVVSNLEWCTYSENNRHAYRIGLNKGTTGIHYTDAARKNMSEAHKGKPLTEETRKKMSEAHKRENLSEETRRKMSEASKRKKYKPLSEKTRRKMSEAKKGNKSTKDRIWINNGMENHMIKPEKLQEFLNNGYVRGRLTT